MRRMRGADASVPMPSRREVLIIAAVKPPMNAEIAKCDGPDCGANIYWVTTVRGAKMPLDAKPVRVLVPARGNMTDRHYTTVTAWVPHWATCPNREAFKRD